MVLSIHRVSLTSLTDISVRLLSPLIFIAAEVLPMMGMVMSIVTARPISSDFFISESILPMISSGVCAREMVKEASNATMQIKIRFIRSYELTRSVFDAPNDVTVFFEDIDGEENGGEFEKAEANPEVKRTKKGDKSWYGGAFETRADIVLKKK